MFPWVFWERRPRSRVAVRDGNREKLSKRGKNDNRMVGDRNDPVEKGEGSNTGEEENCWRDGLKWVEAQMLRGGAVRRPWRSLFREVLEGRSSAVETAGGDVQHSIWLSGSHLKVLGVSF